MKTSKIAVFHGKDESISLGSTVIPPLEEGEILVKNEYTTLCRSDLNTYCGKRNEKTPTILGHEVVGKIAAFGPNSPAVDLVGNQLLINDRITWAIYASDPNSLQSKAGIPQKSPDLFKYGHEQITKNSNLHGGLGQYTVLRINTPILKINKAIPLKVTAIINCAVATVAGAFRLVGSLEGKRVLVSGVGMLGMVACAMAKVKGASKVGALDINANRLERARDFGADELYEANTEGINPNGLFDIVVELSGINAAMQASFQLMAIGGVAVWVGATYPQPKLKIDAEKVVRNLWTIKGLHNYNSEDFMNAVFFIEENHKNFPFETMVEKQFSLDEVNEAFKYGIDKNPFRVGIKIN